MSAPISAAVAAGAIILGIPVMLAAQTAAAAAEAASAADAAALAAADELVGVLVQASGEPCTIAAEIAQVHGAQLVSCETDEETLEARVTVMKASGLVRAIRAARAGPTSSCEASPCTPENVGDL